MADSAHDNQKELVVDRPLVDELERLGVHAVHVGDRIRLQLIHREAEGSGEALPAFFGSFASGKPGLAERVDEVLPGGEAVSSYLIVIEGDATTNYSAYCPDLLGVVAAGNTVEECRAEMQEAVAFHIEGLIEDGEPVPPPTCRGATVEVAAELLPDAARPVP